jgi:hypothetical protein
LILVDERVIVRDIAVLTITLDVPVARGMETIDPEAVLFFVDYLEQAST